MFERITPTQTKDLSMKQAFAAAYLVVFAVLILVLGIRGINYTFDYLEDEHEVIIKQKIDQNWFDSIERKNALQK
jgi:hypothetical protein